MEQHVEPGDSPDHGAESETGKGLLALLRAFKAGHKLKAEKGN